jgi:hypothetical protein
MTDEQLAEIKSLMEIEDAPYVEELIAALEAERAKIAKIVTLHRPSKLYGECDHKHTEGDGSFEIDDVGLTCEDGFLYWVCDLCCVDGESGQNEDCWAAHNHTKDDTAYCATMRAIKSEEIK